MHDRRDLIQNVVECSLSLRSGVSLAGLDTVGSLLRVLGDSSRGSSLVELIVWYYQWTLYSAYVHTKPYAYMHAVIAVAIVIVQRM